MRDRVLDPVRGLVWNGARHRVHDRARDREGDRARDHLQDRALCMRLRAYACVQSTAGTSWQITQAERR